MRTYHVCQSVQGALNNWTAKEWRLIASENKTTVEELKRRFNKMKKDGIKVIPIGNGCEGFSSDSGCPGHDEP